MAADPIIYCLEHVTDYDQFERLCSDLMAAEGYTEIEPLGGMRDKGRDAIHVDRHHPDNVTIFAYSVRDNWRKKLAEDCEKIRSHGHHCRHVMFSCTSTYTPAERDEAVTWVKTVFGWQLDLYGLERLRILLGTVHPQIIANHPHIFCAPFFPDAGGLTTVDSPDHLIIDYADSDEALATWLARRLTLDGYRVWCRGIDPIGGSSLNGTLETLIRHRAFRLLTILSPASVLDPDLSARRSMAFTIRHDLLLPIVAAPVDTNKLDAKTRGLEAIFFDDNWAKGLSQLLNLLTSKQCPRSPGGASIAIRSFLPHDVVCAEPETLYSNRFRVLEVPEGLKRFTSTLSMEDDAFLLASLQWAFRRVDPRCFVAFDSPPAELNKRFNIKPAGGIAWRHASDIDGIAIRNLVPELIRKSTQVLCMERGLRFCNDQKVLYFPDGLTKSDRLYFTKPDGSKSFVNSVGERTYWRPGLSVPYKYQLAPGFSTVHLTETSLAVLVRLRVRFTDQHGAVLPARTATSRRKHLCKNWWNDDWFNRTLATMQFLSSGDRIVIGSTPAETIAIATAPDQWTVPLRINEAVLEGAAEAHEDVLSYLAEAIEESDNE
jgi:hypothetical protein